MSDRVETPFDDLERELVALGRSVRTDPPRGDLASEVLARLGPLHAEGQADTGTVPLPWPARGSRRAPTGGPGWLRGRRLGWAATAATVLVLALIPPVRAAVIELLRVGGVVVREVPPPTPPPTPPAPRATTTGAQGQTTSAGTSLTLERARALVGFDFGVPASLGSPTSVAVAREGRVVTMTWRTSTGVTQLDVFDGSLSWGYLKQVWEVVTPTDVSGHEAVWLGEPHLIEWIDRGGGTHAETPRLAGPTLVWVVPSATGELTYRLEGVDTQSEATAIAASVR